ncbi:MAG: serpin family protein, partial [Acidimicrobiia bacterium]|nr:serpin family protein [Acidimicrobiia bacterium]
DDAAWHAGRNALDGAITTPGQVPPGMTPLELRIANAPFGQAGFDFVDAFIQVLAEQYGADLITADFIADPEAARTLINAWVADQTDDRITDLLPAGSIDSLVRLVLVNTVFFKGQWVTEFDPAQTAPGPFTVLDGSQIETPLMNGSVRTSFGQGDGWQMVRLPYWGGYSMTLVVPDDGRFEEISDRIAAGLLDDVTAIRSDHLVALTMPTFDFATPTDLVPVFRSLGMVDAFDSEAADFSGLTSSDDFYLSGAFHQATIEVDEFGTTATAATGVIGGVTSAPTPAELRIDRPFVFTIEHDETGEPLFLGQVVDPTA